MRPLRAFASASLFALAGLCAATTNAAPVWSDPLAGSEVDERYWIVETSPDTALSVSSAGILMSMLPANTGDGGLMLRSRCSLVGDFDVQVDYELGTWPLSNGVRTALQTWVEGNVAETAMCVGRVSLAPSDVPVSKPGPEVYLASYPGLLSFPTASTNDVKGTYRITRLGTTETTYFAAGGGAWPLLVSTVVTGLPVHFSMAVWSSKDLFRAKTTGASICFRNFVINSGTMSCPELIEQPPESERSSDAGTPAPDGPVDVGTIAPPPDQGADAPASGAGLDAGTSAMPDAMDPGESSPDAPVASDSAPKEDYPDGSGRNNPTARVGSGSGCHCSITARYTTNSHSLVRLALLATILALCWRKRGAGGKGAASGP